MPKLEENDIVTPALLRRFQAEADFEGGSGLFCAFIPRPNGELITHHPGTWMVIPEQVMWAADVLKRLNRELHHDGAWVVCFTDPAPDGHPEAVIIQGSGHREYARYVLMWMDPDADIQFSIEWVRGEVDELLDWNDVLLQGILPVLEKCETAWQIWHENMIRVLDHGEGQTYKRAKGEQAPSTVH